MSILHKQYEALENGQQIKFSVSFNKDKTNWATSQPIDIGYRVSAVPVNIRSTSNPNIQIEEYGAFTGFNSTLLKVDRQSAKRLNTAIGELNLKKEQYLDWFRVKYGLMTSKQYQEKYQ